MSEGTLFLEEDLILQETDAVTDVLIRSLETLRHAFVGPRSLARSPWVHRLITVLLKVRSNCITLHPYQGGLIYE